MAVHGHPSSLILAPVESVYAIFLFFVNSNLGPILPSVIDIAGILLKTALHPYSTPNWTRLPRSEDSKLINHVITVELTRGVHPPKSHDATFSPFLPSPSLPFSLPFLSPFSLPFPPLPPRRCPSPFP